MNITMPPVHKVRSIEKGVEELYFNPAQSPDLSPFQHDYELDSITIITVGPH